MKTGLFLLARTASQRLPKKSLLKVGGKPLLAYQLERLKRVQKPDCLVLCTTSLKEDDILADLALEAGFDIFRGANEDVIERMLQAAEFHKVDFIVCVGGDNIFADPPHIDKVVERYKETLADFVYCPDLPVGCSSYSAKTEAMKHLHHIKQGKTDGWEMYFINTGIFRVERVPVVPELCRPELRMTLDYPEDFEFFKAILKNLYVPGKFFSLKEILCLLEARPDIAALGQKRKEDWLQQRKIFDIRISP